MELAKWFYNGIGSDLAVWIGRDGACAVHSNRMGCAIPIKHNRMAHRFINRYQMIAIEARPDGILFATT